MKIKSCLINGIFLISFVLCFGHEVFAYVLDSPWPNARATFYSKGDSNALWNDAFIQALDQWNNLSNFTYYYIDAYTDPCSYDYIPKNSWAFAYTECGERFGRTTLSVTFSSYNNLGQRIESDIVFNANEPWNVFSGKWAGAYDFRRVAVHELGHALGLNHDNRYPAIMNSTYSESIETPQTDDINGLRALYGGGGENRANVEAFVTRFYQQCLSREPEQAGLDAWANALLDGSLSGADVAYGFIFSQEFINRNTSNEDFVTILYRAFLNREHDSAGFNTWLDILNGSPTGDRTTREQVLNGFIYSVEFENFCISYGISPYSA